MRPLLLFSLCLLLTACLPAAEDQRARDHRADTSRLVLMAWNVEFLWDGRAPEEGRVDFAWKGSPRKAEAHMADVAAIVKAHDPDILHLSEVENRRALDTFNEKFLAESGYRAYFVPGTDTATGQDVALLSRVELESISRDSRRGRSGTVRKGVSKHYVATLRSGDLRLGLIGIHLLAQPHEESRVAKREAQADAVRGMARELAESGRSVVVWGDFNDFDGRTLGRSGRRPITRVMEWIRDLDPGDASDDLINAAERLPQAQRYTNGRDAIDHVLLSPDLAERLVGVWIPHDHDPHAVTNHFPIIVELRVLSDLTSINRRCGNLCGKVGGKPALGLDLRGLYQVAQGTVQTFVSPFESKPYRSGIKGRRQRPATSAGEFSTGSSSVTLRIPQTVAESTFSSWLTRHNDSSGRALK